MVVKKHKDFSLTWVKLEKKNKDFKYLENVLK